MRWPPWSSSDDPNEPSSSRSPHSSWTSPSLPTDWRHYTSPSTILPVVLLTTSILLSRRVYKRYLRRIPSVTDQPDDFWHNRSLFGKVTSVGDGDGCRVFHTPGGRLAGWGWFPGRTIPKEVKLLKGNTISIRLAGVDAPEGAHFGKPGQPGSQEALEWLTSYINGRWVRLYAYRRDQYSRAVATVYVRKWFLKRDASLELLKRGLAVVYEANTGAEFGKWEKRYRNVESQAKTKRIGIWADKHGETPGEYKKRMAADIESKAGVKEENTKEDRKWFRWWWR